MGLAQAWEEQASRWVRWARAEGHDSYWRFHRRALLRLLPPPGRLTVDLGCGEGRVTRDLVELGHRVVGFDRSPTMVTASATHPDASAPVGLADGAALPLRDGVADLVLAFMALQDIDGVGAAVAEAARVLGPGGRFHLAIVHPINSAGRFGEDGPEPPFVLEGSYFEERTTVDDLERDGLAMRFTSVHRTLEAYSRLLEGSGFVIERIREVTDPHPASNYRRVPLFLHLTCVAPPWMPIDRRLFHIAWPGEWEELSTAGQREPPSLASEGFVHLSTAAQVVASTERHYPVDGDLVLLELDPEALDDDVRWPEVYPGERFPHLHGPLQRASVAAVHPWSPEDRRRWPEAG